jgi:hypothetical protein
MLGGDPMADDAASAKAGAVRSAGRFRPHMTLAALGALTHVAPQMPCSPEYLPTAGAWSAR